MGFGKLSNSQNPNLHFQPFIKLFDIDVKMDLEQLIWTNPIWEFIMESFDLLWTKPFENLAFRPQSQGDKFLDSNAETQCGSNPGRKIWKKSFFYFFVVLAHIYESILGQICPTMVYQGLNIHTISLRTCGKQILDSCQWPVHVLGMFKFCHAPNHLFCLVEHPPCSLDRWPAFFSLVMKPSHSARIWPRPTQCMSSILQRTRSINDSLL